jgi:hypothetical protein
MPAPTVSRFEWPTPMTMGVGRDGVVAVLEREVGVPFRDVDVAMIIPTN